MQLLGTGKCVLCDVPCSFCACGQSGGGGGGVQHGPARKNNHGASQKEQSQWLWAASPVYYYSKDLDLKKLIKIKVYFKQNPWLIFILISSTCC